MIPIVRTIFPHFPLANILFSQGRKKLHWVGLGDLLVICGSIREWNGMLRKIQNSELFSKLFHKLETLEFYSLASCYIQSSKPFNASAMDRMFVSPQKMYMLKSNPQGDGIIRWESGRGD